MPNLTATGTITIGDGTTQCMATLPAAVRSTCRCAGRSRPARCRLRHTAPRRVAVDDAEARGERRAADATRIHLDDDLRRPFDRLAEIRVQRGQDRCGILTHPAGIEAAEPVQARFLDIGRVHRIVDVVVGIHVAPAHRNRGADEQLRRHLVVVHGFVFFAAFFAGLGVGGIATRASSSRFRKCPVCE